MKDAISVGIKHTHTFQVNDNKTVAKLYPEADSFQIMPPVFATGFMVGFLEWACMEAIKDFLEDDERTVGTHIDVSHQAATPVGMTVTANVELSKIDGKKLTFLVEAFDEKDCISKGTHERFVINHEKFLERLKAKADA